VTVRLDAWSEAWQAPRALEVVVDSAVLDRFALGLGERYTTGLALAFNFAGGACRKGKRSSYGCVTFGAEKSELAAERMTGKRDASGVDPRNPFSRSSDLPCNHQDDQ
jgi:hypothetical protein